MKTASLISLTASLFVVSTVSAQQPCKSTVVGDLRVEHFESKIYGKAMTVRTWLPPGYGDEVSAARKYPTLYLLDGQNAFDECTAFHGEHELQVDETVTRLIAESQIPPMIVVGIDSTEDRDYEYEPYKNPINDAKEREPIGNQLPLFFAAELIPTSPLATVSRTTRLIPGLVEPRWGLPRHCMWACSARTCSGWFCLRVRTSFWATGSSYATRPWRRGFRTGPQSESAAPN